MFVAARRGGSVMRHGVRTTWRLRSTVFLAVCAAAYWHLHAPTVPAARPFIVAGGLAFLAANLISVVVRVPLGHRHVPGIGGDLGRELLLGVLAPASVLAALAVWPHSDIALAAIVALLFLLHGDYVELQVRLAEKVRDGGRRTFGDWVRERRAPSGPDTSRRVGDVHDFKKEPIGRVWLAARLTDPRERGLSYMRLILFWLIASGFWVGADALASQAVDHYLAPPPPAKEELHRHHHGHQGPQEETVGAGSGGGGQEGSDREGAKGTKSGCSSQTPLGAPRWARHDLRALYLGGLGGEATKPPGFRIGGCPGRAVVPAGLDGSFVYAVGRGPGGEIRSLVVDSERFGPEIFLAPAAQKVLALIGSGVIPLGGHPRLFPAGGDVVTVTTPEGTIVLVRAEEHEPGRVGVATPYIELPATVATAWLGAMGEAERWLWPLQPRPVAGGMVYGLAENPGGHATYKVIYDPRTGGATRDGFTYTRPETPLGYLELKAWAEPGSVG
jgi:hypothetical protein